MIQKPLESEINANIGRNAVIMTQTPSVLTMDCVSALTVTHLLFYYYLFQDNTTLSTT